MVSKIPKTSATSIVNAPIAKQAKSVAPKLVKPVAPTAKPVIKVRNVASKQVTNVSRKVAATPQVVAKVAPSKVKKPKLIRDSFTMPKEEYVAIDSLKIRAGKLGQSIKKSELLRAGIKALVKLSDIQFKAALSEVPALKTGRPKHVK